MTSQTSASDQILGRAVGVLFERLSRTASGSPTSGIAGGKSSAT